MYAEASQSLHHNLQLQTPEDYRKAIATLEASTHAIEPQIAMTQECLDVLAQRQLKARPTTTNRHQAILAQILSQHKALTEYLNATSSDLQKAISAILMNIEDTLSRDDYTFDHIAQSTSAVGVDGQTVTSDGGFERGEDDITSNKTQRLIDALHRTEAEVIRTRLERIYLETINALPPQSSKMNGTRELDTGFDHADPTKTAAIRNDLRTLYAEIEDVTSLFVAHEHGDALSQLEENMKVTEETLKRQKGQWASQRIREVRGRLLGLEENVRGVQGQRIVVGKLGALLAAVDAVGTGGSSSSRLEGVAGVGKRDADGPALIGLRGYLGVGVAGAGGGDRVEASFRDVKTNVAKALEIQKDQAGMLKKNDGSVQHDQDDGEAAGIPREIYAQMLDELDVEIATIKEGIEKLPTR